MANIFCDSPFITKETHQMTLKPYPSISRIAAHAGKKGYVVGIEDGETVIETGTVIIKFKSDRTIVDSENKEVTMDEALKQLKIDLQA